MTVDLSLTSFAAVALLLAITTAINLKAQPGLLNAATYALIWLCLILLTVMTVALVVAP